MRYSKSFYEDGLLKENGEVLGSVTFITFNNGNMLNRWLKNASVRIQPVDLLDCLLRSPILSLAVFNGVVLLSGRPEADITFSTHPHDVGMASIYEPNLQL